jgi:hypothetical protein
MSIPRGKSLIFVINSCNTRIYYDISHVMVNLRIKTMSDLATQLNNFRNALQIQGEQDEGKDGSTGGISNDTYESATFPKGVEINDSNGEGTIRYPFDYRVRHKHYALGVETATDDTNAAGMITANYIIGRSGKV